MAKDKGNFSEGSLAGHIFRLAVPIFLADMVHLLYNVVDRMFIGHIPGEGTLALSGVGVIFPLISFINAFAGLFSSGGAPLCSIARGEGDEDKAKRILQTCFTMLILSGVVLTVAIYLFLDKLIFVLGGDELTLPFAKGYFSIYILGTVFVLISLGANPFINMQGNSIVGMTTVMIGAILNTILDPIFIFTLGMGVKGAAVATVISQGVSALWVVLFLTGKKASVRVTSLKVDFSVLPKILKLGVSGFVFKMTNSMTQALVNMTLRIFGGASGSLYIGATSIINSMREMLCLPTTSICNSAQPIISYNYGAKKNLRVRKSIIIMTFSAFAYGLAVWALVQTLPQLFISIFTPDQELVEITTPCMRLFFGAFFMMSFQVSGQNTYVALNCPKRAVFFSIFRKVILVLPLTLLFPRIGMGVYGVFVAEMVSQIVGATCNYVTMWFTIYRKLKKTPDGVLVEV